MTPSEVCNECKIDGTAPKRTVMQCLKAACWTNILHVQSGQRAIGGRGQSNEPYLLAVSLLVGLSQTTFSRMRHAPHSISAELHEAHLNLSLVFNFLFSHVQSDMLLCIMFELCLHFLPAGQLLVQLLLAACHLLLQSFGLLSPCPHLKHMCPQFMCGSHRAAFPWRSEMTRSKPLPGCQYRGLSPASSCQQTCLLLLHAGNHPCR